MPKGMFEWSESRKQYVSVSVYPTEAQFNALLRRVEVLEQIQQIQQTDTGGGNTGGDSTGTVALDPASVDSIRKLIKDLLNDYVSSITVGTKAPSPLSNEAELVVATSPFLRLLETHKYPDFIEEILTYNSDKKFTNSERKQAIKVGMTSFVFDVYGEEGAALQLYCEHIRDNRSAITTYRAAAQKGLDAYPSLTNS